MKPREALIGKMIDPTEISEFEKKVHKAGKKIVFTAGSWDLLHVGQMRYLAEAKRRGDILVVGVNSNQAIKKVKGKNKPILDEWIRCETLAFLKDVDFITIIPIPSCGPTLELLKPDIFVSVIEDWTDNVEDSKEYKIVNGYGGKIVMLERQSPFVSTSSIVERIIGSHLGDSFEKYLSKQETPLKERFEEE